MKQKRKLKNKCRIVGHILDAQTKKKIPARVTVKAEGEIKTSEDSRIYEGNRFYAKGKFWIECSPGKTEIEISHGFDYIPIKKTIRAIAGKTIVLRFLLKKWIDMKALGWFCGDIHLHIHHNGISGLKKPPDPEFATLVCRAEGLDYAVEQGSIDSVQSSRDKFPHSIIQISEEEQYPLNGHYLKLKDVRVVTHPFGCIPAFHWMTAIKVYFDVVLGRYPQALDVFCYNKDAEQLIYFTLLNLGARISATASTDACLERREMGPVGRQRVYTHTSKFSYEEIIEGLKKGRNFVTDGPVFPIFTIDGAMAGETLIPESGRVHTAKIQIFALNRIKRVEIIRNGNVIKEFKPLVKQKHYTLRLKYEFRERNSCWYAVRAVDEQGRSALTNPVYFENPVREEKFKYCLMCCLGNFTSDLHLEKKFNLHIACAIGNGIIKKVFLFKDGIPRQEFPLSVNTGAKPARGSFNPYLFTHPAGFNPVYFEACYPLENPGYYHVQIETSGGTLLSQPFLYDTSVPNSYQITYLRTGDSTTSLEIRGWCEDIPLSEIGRNPDHICWFNKDRAWEIRANFSGVEHKLQQGTDLSAFFTEL